MKKSRSRKNDNSHKYLLVGVVIVVLVGVIFWAMMFMRGSTGQQAVAGEAIRTATSKVALIGMKVVTCPEGLSEFKNDLLGASGWNINPVSYFFDKRYCGTNDNTIFCDFKLIYETSSDIQISTECKNAQPGPTANSCYCRK